MNSTKNYNLEVENNKEISFKVIAFRCNESYVLKNSSSFENGEFVDLKNKIHTNITDTLILKYD